jgi:microcystin-dependent protein
MMTLSLNAVVQIASRMTEKSVVLSPFSAALFLSLIADMEDCFRWSFNDGSLSGNECDVVQGMVSKSIEELMRDNMLIGVVVPFMGENLPSNMLLCDGSVYLKSDYPLLWGVLPSGIKDSSTFTIPDLSDKFIMGASSLVSLFDAGGESSHVLTESELPSHSHSLSNTLVSDVDVVTAGVPDITGARVLPVTSYTGYSGGNEAHNNLPPYMKLRYAVIAL